MKSESRTERIFSRSVSSLVMLAEKCFFFSHCEVLYCIMCLFIKQVIQKVSCHSSGCKMKLKCSGASLHLINLSPRSTVSDLDKREDSDAEMAEVMSGFIVLICNSSVRMINKRL